MKDITLDRVVTIDHGYWGTLHAIVHRGDIYYPAQEICRMLGLSRTKTAIKRVPSTLKGALPDGAIALTINGAAMLCIHSNVACALELMEWLSTDCINEIKRLCACSRRCE